MFFEASLEQLRRERFHPAAIRRCVRQAAAGVRRDLDANPIGVRSIWSAAVGFFVAVFLMATVMAVAYDRRLAYDFFLATCLWLVPCFALVTLGIDLLRDRDGFRLSGLNVPVLLTMLRLSLAPGIAIFVLEGHLALALGVYAFASVTDVLDGWLARRLRQITPLGTVLDPLTDIVFNLTIFASLAGAGLLGGWVLAAALLRYGTLLVGGAAFTVFVGPLRIQPTLFGRMTGVVMAALTGLLVLVHAIGGGPAQSLAPLTESALGVLLCATVGHALVLGWYNLRLTTGRAEVTGRVVGDVRWRP